LGEGGLKLFIDECLSPHLARHLNMTGEHDASHPRDMGRLGEPDHVVLARCLSEDRVIVTENAVDFRKLVAREEVHPGLILLPSVARDASLRLLTDAIAHLETIGEPSDAMVNHVLEVSEAGSFTLSAMPE
jgi:predicted nuclease of predicted toxin-antitoxin system